MYVTFFLTASYISLKINKDIKVVFLFHYNIYL